MTGERGWDGLSARKWQRQSADHWLAYRSSPESESSKLASRFCEAVTSLFDRAIGSDAALAAGVIAELEPTLSKCDQLRFSQFPQTLAYLLWHEVDRYYRVTQALDLLFRRGALPIAKPDRPLRLLEVGSGPAPAAYATVDYYAALGAWSQQHSTGFASSGAVAVHTIDRGPAWTKLIHELSEELIVSVESGSNFICGSSDPFFDVTYSDLRGFNPRAIHNASRDAHRQRLLQLPWEETDDDSFDFYQGPFGLDRHAADVLAARAAPPSAYDLIVVANFVTNEVMLQELMPDLETLAQSLVPGGVLLTLSAANNKYQTLWDRFSDLMHNRRLDQEVAEVLQAHAGTEIHTRVACVTINALRQLRVSAPAEFGAAKLPAPVQAEVDAALAVPSDAPVAIAAGKFRPYPKFQVHAFKRGGRAIPEKDRKRIAERNKR